MRNSATSILMSRLGSVLCGMVTLTVTSRALGPDGRGVVATVTSLLLLAPIVASFGLPMSIRRVHAIAPALKASQDLSSAKAVAVPIGTGVAVLTVAMLVTSGTGLHPNGLALALALGVCTMSGIWWLTDANALLGTGRVGDYATVLVLPSALLAALISVAGMAGVLTVTSAIVCQVLAYVATAGYSASKTHSRPDFRLRRHGRVLCSSTPYMGGQIAEALSYRLDQTVAIVFIGAAGAGQYSIAATIGMLPSTLGLAVASATFREIATSSVSEGRSPMIGVRVALLAAIPAAVVAACLTPWVVPFVFGNDFRPAVPATLLSLLGSLFLVMCQGAGNVLIAEGKGWRLSMALLLGLVCSLIGLAVLGPHMGVVGASAAAASGFLISAACCLYFLGATWSSWVPRRSDFRRVVATFTTGRL
ncbi:lipopolysaccharide biosynthesis protein [Janibacter hoylei]